MLEILSTEMLEKLLIELAVKRIDYLISDEYEIISKDMNDIIFELRKRYEERESKSKR